METNSTRNLQQCEHCFSRVADAFNLFYSIIQNNILENFLKKENVTHI